MLKRIEKVAVLGAGTMGSRIAAHLANAGVRSYLLDIVPPDAAADAPAAVRNRIAESGLDAARKSKPAAFMEPGLARLVTTGNFEDHLGLLAECDWIIEAVVENLDLKRALLRKVEAVRKPGTIVTTNTSGLPVHSIAEGFSDDFRRHWFGTHFFNPPRYMRLLEIIPTPETDPAAIEAIAQFASVRLGKGIVYCQGHAELHRQPHRHLQRGQHRAPHAGVRLLHRGGGCADRLGHRLSRSRQPSAPSTWWAWMFWITWSGTPSAWRRRWPRAGGGASTGLEAR